MKSSVIVGLLLSGSPLLAQTTAHSSVAVAEVKETSSPTTHLSISTGMLGRSLEDKYVNSKYAGATMDLSGSHAINDQLEARLAVGFFLTAGSYSNLYGSEGAAPNVVYLDEAAVTYKPLSFLSIEAGVILTEFSSLPSNLEALGFPSFRQTLHTSGDNYKAELYATQAIPTSDTAAVQATKSGITTTLQVYGLSATTNPNDQKGLTVAGSISRFEFKNLNTSAASDSSQLGNTVDGGLGPQARFRYGYAGTETGARLAYRFSNGFKSALSGAFIRNEEAPSDRNRGYMYTGALELPMGTNVLSGSLGYFYNESDTLPASYTSSRKGSNNRFGQVGRVMLSNHKKDVSGYVQYTRANEIVNKPYTADRDIVVLGLELGYDIL